MKKIFYLFLAVALMCTVSCSKDEGDIVGAWKLSQYFYGYYENGKQIEGEWTDASLDFGDDVPVVTFQADGKGTVSNPELNEPIQFVWEYDSEEKNLFMEYEGEPVNFKVESLKGNEMVWIVYEAVYEEDGVTFREIEKIKFKK